MSTPMPGTTAVVHHLPDRGRGIFTSVKVADQRPMLLESHLQRLRRSALQLWGMALPDNIEAGVRNLCGNAAPGDRLRIDVVPGAGCLDVTLDLSSLPIPSAPLSVAVVRVTGWDGRHKWIDRYDFGGSCLLVDEDDNVLEFGHAAVAALVEGEFVVPPLDGRVLPSIGRQYLEAAARAVDVPIRHRPIPVVEATANPLFAINALRGIVSVASVGGRPLPLPGLS